jgi:septum formation protein
MNFNLPRIILASASPRRCELLRQLGLEFEAIPSRAEEAETEYLTGTELAQLNAYRKARAISKRFPDELVLGMDTVVCLGTTLFGKPRDLEEAEAMLQRLQGRTHQVVTGVCLSRLRAHRQRIFAEMTHVTFRPLSREQIREYYAHVNPMDKAGGYAIQERGDELIEEIAGSFSNVVGLPLERLSEELVQFRIDA